MKSHTDVVLLNVSISSRYQYQHRYLLLCSYLVMTELKCDVPRDVLSYEQAYLFIAARSH